VYSYPNMSQHYSVLILFAHPAPMRSRVNTTLLHSARDLDHVVVNDLYENYPNFYIDIKREQTLLIQADLIIFHHPIYWYSTPAILKEWQDVVLERGFAYGTNGNALRGKDFMLAISTGGSADAYQALGYHHCTLDAILRPLQQTANLCGLLYRPPMVIHNSFQVTDAQINAHAQRYRDLLLSYTRQGSMIFNG